MGNFSEGMRMGQTAYQTMLDNQQREKEFEIKKKLTDQQLAEGGLRIEGLTRDNDKANSDAAAAARYQMRVNGQEPTTPDEEAFGPVPVKSTGLQPPSQATDRAVTPAGLPTPAPVAAPPAISERNRQLALAKMFEEQQKYGEAGTARDKAIDYHIDELRADVAKKLADPRQRADMVSQLNIGQYTNIPIYSAGDLTDAKGNPTGHKLLVVGKDGKQDEIRITNAQMIDIAAGEQALVNGYGAKGMALINGVSTKLGDAVKEYNSGVEKAVTTGETAATNQAKGLVDIKNADSSRMHAQASLTQAANDTARTNSVIQERTAEATRKDAAIKAIDTLMPDLDAAVRSGDKTKINGVLTRMGADSARTSGDAAKLLTALRERVPGSSLTSASVRFTAENLWNTTEQKLREADTPEPRIQAQKEGFMAMRGIAPEGVEATVLAGKDPSGQPLDEAAVDHFNKLYPNSAIDKSQLPWLKPGAPATPAATKAGGLPEPTTYGLLSGPRLGYLQQQAKNKTITPKERVELEALTKTKGSAWFRGQASAEDSLAN